MYYKNNLKKIVKDKNEVFLSILEEIFYMLIGIDEKVYTIKDVKEYINKKIKRLKNN